MINRLSHALMLAVVGLLFSSSLPAHHGTGINYDTSIKYTIPAVVTKFRYAQPHLQIFLEMEEVSNEKSDAPDEDAAVATEAEAEAPKKTVKWACEYVPNIPFLIRQGYSRKKMQKALPVGANITVTMTPARSGKSVCLVHKMVSSEGELIGPDLEALIMQGSRK